MNIQHGLRGYLQARKTARQLRQRNIIVDLSKRDAKIAQKLETIYKAGLERYEIELRKALRTLFDIGLQQARAEAGWCDKCQGRGYFTRRESGVPLVGM